MSYRGIAIDTRDLPDLEGFQFRVEVYQDEDCAAPEHSDDLYSMLSMEQWEAHLQAWRKQDWTYVEAWVRCSRGGIELGTSSMGSMEYGWSPLWDQKLVTPLDDEVSLHGCRDDLMREALEEAKLQIGRLTAGIEPGLLATWQQQAKEEDR